VEWSKVREYFPNQWLELIPLDACEKYGKQYVDEVAVIDIVPAESVPNEPYKLNPGYLSFVYHTSKRHCVFDEGTLPEAISSFQWTIVGQYGVLEMIYDEGRARGLLSCGLTPERVADKIHLPLHVVEEIIETLESEQSEGDIPKNR